MSAALLVNLLTAPEQAVALSPADWTGLLTAARAERLLGTLALLLAGDALPDDVAAILADARLEARRERRQALWEVDRALAALRPLGLPLILLKGSAFVAANLKAGVGRSIGDLDILVPRARLDAVEAALLDAGWEWVKPDPYDDAYYRRWMHELPPLIHHERDRMIDVHHNILPLTARPTPDAEAMIAAAVSIGPGLAMLRLDDMLCHAAAHLLADGDMAGGLRNLWDIHWLLQEDGAKAEFWSGLEARAAHHGLRGAVRRAVRLSHRLFATPAPPAWVVPVAGDGLFVARLLARNGWGSEDRALLRQGFYVRSHLLRMPPLMLARHLWIKWRKGYRPVA